MGVSKNNGTPKSSHVFLRVFPLFSPSILGGLYTPLLGNIHIINPEKKQIPPIPVGFSSSSDLEKSTPGGSSIPNDLGLSNHMSQGRSTPWSLGMGDLPPLIGNPYFMGI